MTSVWREERTERSDRDRKKVREKESAEDCHRKRDRQTDRLHKREERGRKGEGERKRERDRSEQEKLYSLAQKGRERKKRGRRK